MKRLISIGLFLLFLASSAMAQNENNSHWQTTHKGLDFRVKGGYALGLGDASGSNMYSVGGSVGKRIDNMYFGLGSGALMSTESGSDAIIPITLDTEYYLMKGRVAPVLQASLGYGINTASDQSVGKEKIKMPNYLIFQVMPGATLAVSRSMDLDLGIGLIGLTAVGGSKGMGGHTNVFLSFSGALTFHRSTNPKPKKPKKPTRERGVQIAFEGGKTGFSSDEDDYHGGNFAIAFTYKFNHHLSAGLGYGGDFVDGMESRGRYLKTDANGKTLTDNSVLYPLESAFKVFLRGQYNLTKKRLSPFVACDAGVRFYQYDSFDIGSYEEAEDYIGKPSSVGAYVEPSIGVSLRTTNNSYLDLKVGYAFAPNISDSMKEEKIDEGYRAGYRSSLSVSAPFVSLGFRHTFKWGSKWGK